MSEQKFNEAKGQLALSQRLVDEMRRTQRPQMAQQSPEIEELPERVEEEVVEPQEQPVEEPKQESSLTSMFTSFMEEVRGMFQNLMKMEKEEKEDEDEVEMSKKDMVEEHERLVDVLESPSHEDDKGEAEKQKEELEEYKK